MTSFRNADNTHLYIPMWVGAHLIAHVSMSTLWLRFCEDSKTVGKRSCLIGFSMFLCGATRDGLFVLIGVLSGLGAYSYRMNPHSCVSTFDERR